MNRKAILAAVAAIGITASVLAAQPEEKKPEGPKPPPEVEKLSYFIGPWTTEGEIKQGPMGSGGAVQGRQMCRWMPGKFFVGCMVESKSPTGTMQIEAMMGYDADKKVYKWWSFDNLGQAESATGTLKDGTWTWLGNSKVGDKTVQTRYTISDTTPDGYATRWESSPDGKAWTPLMTGKVTKMTPPRRAVGAPDGAKPAPPAVQQAPPPEKKN
jgi:Protein of unknown function (DUF1579)